jgi:hypothetical protein
LLNHLIMMRSILFAVATLATIASTSHAASKLYFREPLPMRSVVAVIDTPIVDTAVDADSLAELDSLLDSLEYSFDAHGISHRRWHRPHVFVLNQIERTKQSPYREELPIMDFNRVDGFYLGLSSGGMSDFGSHDEIGVDAGGGYGFASKRWQGLLGLEYRLPIVNWKELREQGPRIFYGAPTIAIGGEVHNVTSTDDGWRTGRIENAAFAFFAREDFRDYYKLAGWDAYIALRPMRDVEWRVAWRSDHYESLGQNVFYGRFGGNKVLPPNPIINDGEMHSLAVTGIIEKVHPRVRQVINVFGDPVWVEQLEGHSDMMQAEFGHMPGSDFGFNRYQLDGRRFLPLTKGINFDYRIRAEATTGDPVLQKLEYLGGPGSLPGLYRKSLAGNRELLVNTELRLNVNMLTRIFHSPDLSLIVYNDFGSIGWAGADQGIFKGYGLHGINSILYNVGAGIGWTRGVQLGASWRTDIKEDPRWIVRFQRSF